MTNLQRIVVTLVMLGTAITGLSCWSSACSDAAFTVIAPLVTIGGGIVGYKLVTRRGTWQPVDLTRDY